VALKTGLLAKSWKFLVAALFALKKLLIVLVLGIGAFFKRILAAIRARFFPQDEVVTLPPQDPPAPKA
jgi:hypothetical protein